MQAKQWRLFLPLGLMFCVGCSSPADDYAGCPLPPEQSSSLAIPERASPEARRSLVEARVKEKLVQCLRTQAFAFAPAEAPPEQVARAATGRCIGEAQSYESFAGFRYFDFEQFNPSFTEQMAIRQIAREEIVDIALAAAMEARARGCPTRINN